MKNAAPPTSKKIIVGIPVPKNSCKTKFSQKLDTGKNASLIISSIPFCWENKDFENIKKDEKIKSLDLNIIYRFNLEVANIKNYSRNTNYNPIWFL